MKEALQDCDGRALDFFALLVFGPKARRRLRETDKDFRKRLTMNKKQKEHIERVMRAYDELIAIGYLVPSLDTTGRQIMRKGQPVYKRTDDPRILAKVNGLCGNN
jgi:hypothetical protein